MKVYNALVLERNRKVGKGELLLLIPRCLSRATLDGVLQIAGKYDVPVFVATRGQLARRVIRERRPRAVVAVACERDMVSGLHDVAGKVPVLGLTMTLPSGPCKDALLDLAQLEEWVKAYVSLRMRARLTRIPRRSGCPPAAAAPPPVRSCHPGRRSVAFGCATTPITGSTRVEPAQHLDSGRTGALSDSRTRDEAR